MNKMKIGEAIERLQAIQREKGADCEIGLEEVSSDRYGDTIGLVADHDKSNPILSEYFGGEMPRW